MDTLFKIISVALITCVACMVVKPVRADFAVLLSIVGGIIIILYMVSYFADIFKIFDSIFHFSGVNSSIYSVVLKIIGVGYLTEFASSVCSDTGNSSLADKVLLGGKIVILVMSLPIVTSILDIVMQLLPK